MTSSAEAEAALPPPSCPAGRGGAPVPLYGPEFAADPAPVYETLRGRGPVEPVELAPGVDALLVTDYDAALRVVRDPDTFVKDARRWRALTAGQVPADSPVLPMMAYRPSALFADGDAHTRLRRAITDSLSRVDPNALRGYVERSAGTLIDAFAPRGEADMFADYASVLPLLVFSQLFGVPDDAMGRRLVAGSVGMLTATPEGAQRASEDLLACLAELVALKRKAPGADLTSWLLAHPAELADDELLHQLVLIVGAGTTMSTAFTCNALLLLLTDDRFAGDLAGGSLPVEDALEEVLWVAPPGSNFSVHYAVRETAVAGVTVPPGVPVVISHVAVNADPKLASERRSGNRGHLAWSAGPHRCPAQSEARLISTVALETLLDRLPDLDLRVPAERVVWQPGPFYRCPAALPVTFTAAPATAPPATAPPPAAGASPARPTDPGEPAWTAPARPAPARSASTSAAATSTGRPPASGSADRRHWWSSLARWWRGR
ncbi:cytochrome P450 [Streptomyces capparidis]